MNILERKESIFLNVIFIKNNFIFKSACNYNFADVF